ncbi:uncharacterized protein [Littorina saxatilis]|uniref:uncharacterized protein isoform X3 n=1 Tax=Littorina saxatilis TaxID=31220 RepID=UPI0038B56AE5
MARANNMPVNGPVLRLKAEQFAKEIGLSDWTCSESWVKRFTARHGMTFRKISGAAAAQWNQHHPDWIPTLHMGHDILWQSDSSRKKPAVGGRRADVQGAACSSDEETHPEEPAAASQSSSIQMSPASTRSKTEKRRVISTGIQRGGKKVIRQDQSDEGVINVGREIARWCQLAEELGVISNEALAGILLDLYYAQRSPAHSDDGEAVSNPLARPVALYKVAARSSPRSSIEDMATEAAECNGTAEQHDMTALAEVKVETDVAQDPLLLGQHSTHHQLNRPVKEAPGSENTASSLQMEDTSPAPQVSSTYLDVRVKQEPCSKNTASSLQMEDTSPAPQVSSTYLDVRVKEEPCSKNTASSLQTEDTSPAPQVSSTYLDVRVKEEPGSENTASSLQTEDTSPAPQVSSTYLDV